MLYILPDGVKNYAVPFQCSEKRFVHYGPESLAMLPSGLGRTGDSAGLCCDSGGSLQNTSSAVKCPPFWKKPGRQAKENESHGLNSSLLSSVGEKKSS